MDPGRGDRIRCAGVNRNVLIVLALAATAAALWFVTSLSVSSGRPPASQPSADAEPPTGAQPEEAPVQPKPAEPATQPTATTAAAPRPAPPPPAKLPPPEKTGPADELKARYASDRRDASAGELEKEISAAFVSADVPASLLHSVSCRATVCRVETRWAPDRGIGFMSAFTRLLMIAPDDPTPRLFDTNLGISPEGAPDAVGVRAVDVYLARLPQTEPAR